MCNHRNISITRRSQVCHTDSEWTAILSSISWPTHVKMEVIVVHSQYHINIPCCHTLHMVLNSDTVIHHCAHTYYIHTSTYILSLLESIYIMQCVFVCLFVCLFVCGKCQNYGMDWHQPLRNYKKWPGECPLWVESPVLVLSGRHCEISSFSFAADCHFYILSFHFRLLPRLLLTQSAFAKTLLMACRSREAYLWRPGFSASS